MQTKIAEIAAKGNFYTKRICADEGLSQRSLRPFSAISAVKVFSFGNETAAHSRF